MRFVRKIPSNVNHCTFLCQLKVYYHNRPFDKEFFYVHFNYYKRYSFRFLRPEGLRYHTPVYSTKMCTVSHFTDLDLMRKVVTTAISHFTFDKFHILYRRETMH